jgi:hypothetical protein
MKACAIAVPEEIIENHENRYKWAIKLGGGAI